TKTSPTTSRRGTGPQFAVHEFPGTLMTCPLSAPVTTGALRGDHRRRAHVRPVEVGRAGTWWCSSKKPDNHTRNDRGRLFLLDRRRCSGLCVGVYSCLHDATMGMAPSGGRVA